MCRMLWIEGALFDPQRGPYVLSTIPVIGYNLRFKALCQIVIVFCYALGGSVKQP